MRIAAKTIVLFLSLMRCIQAAEDTGIQSLLGQFLESWNRHDAHEFSLVFSTDADLTDWRGEHVHGRAAVEAKMRPSFAGPIFKDSTYSGRIRMVRYLRPDIAIVDVDWDMTGARSADGSPRPTRKGLLDWVCVKQEGRWRIVAFHNTDFTAASVIAK
jgi:uncharacterized protein (TIGR02246 family)